MQATSTVRRGRPPNKPNPPAPFAETSTLDPFFVTLSEAKRLSGFSNTDIYRRAARGEIIFRKNGSRTLVDFASLKAAVTGLPLATINVAV
jgi:hypothetical protein